MKKIHIILCFLASLSFMSCDYQNGPQKILTITQSAETDTEVSLPPPSGPSSPDVTDEDTTVGEDNAGGEDTTAGGSDDVVLTLDENFDLFFKSFVVETGLENFDTLVKYKELVQGKNKDIELRSNLYEQIKNYEFDSVSREEKVAFLVNVYNFFAIETVIKYYEQGGKSSISDIFGKGSFKAFDNVSYNVAGRVLSLNQIEKKVLKPLLTFENGSVDARFHFVVICAAKGCPILLDESYKADQLDRQFDLMTKRGLELHRNYQFKDNTTYLTQLFNWYKDDFENHSVDGKTKSASVTNFIQEFLPGASVNNNVKFIHYDWSLNRYEN